MPKPKITIEKLKTEKQQQQEKSDRAHVKELLIKKEKEILRIQKVQAEKFKKSQDIINKLVQEIRKI